MNTWLYIIIGVVVAALIGGITNHLAIKMLFHPRQQIRFAGWRVPFTPGLIPKRKDEIAGSLGKVVAEYLVTSQGLIRMLRKPEFQSKLHNKLTEFVVKWTGSEMTVEQVALRVVSAEQLQSAVDTFGGWADRKIGDGLTWLWEQQGYSSITISQLIPDWSEEKREDFVQWGTETLLRELEREITSPRGDLMLRQMTGQLMEQAGGFLGTLAGMFMDADKMNQKIKSALLQQLDSPALKYFISSFIRNKLTDLENMSLSELIRWLTKQEGIEWMKAKISSFLRWDEWSRQLGSVPLVDLLADKREWLLSKVPQAVDQLLLILEHQMDRIVTAVGLPKLVEEQVQQFPIERLEEIILSVSGKEFRAITWLGALLGGMIGLFQSIVMLSMQ